MSDCLFCKIVSGEISSQQVYEDEFFVVFRDLAPVAPIHVLIVPKRHADHVLDLATQEGGAEVLAALSRVLPKLVEQEGLQGGFRFITNCGKDGGQTIPHLHFHLIGGESLPSNLI